MKTSTTKTITAKELEEKFDNGEDVSEYFDSENARASLRIMIPVLLRKELSIKAKKENITIEELVVKILKDALIDKA